MPYKNNVVSRPPPSRIYSQPRQNYLNHSFQAKVVKQLPKQFPEPLSVGKLDVGNFACSNSANTLQARNYLKYISSGRVKVGKLLPDRLLK